MKLRPHILSLRPLYAGVAAAALGAIFAPPSPNAVVATGMVAALAADEAPKEAPKDTIRPDLIKILAPTQELLKTQKYQEALVKIAESDAVADKTPFEIYVIESLRANAAQGINDLPTMESAFDKAYGSGKMPVAQQNAISAALAGQMFNAKNYPRAIVWAKRHLANGGTDPQMHQVLFRAYYLSDDIPNAGKELEAIVADDEKAGRVSSEEDLKNLAGIYQEQKNDPGYYATIEKLASNYPNKDYWGNLINSVLRKQEYASYLDINMYRLQALTGNLSKGSQYRVLAQNAMADTHPLEAKKALDAGYAAGVLGTGADEAKDKALRVAVDKKAAEDQKALASDEVAVAKNKDGTGSVNVGINYLSLGQYDKAIALLEQGLAKGGLKHPDQAKLELAYAYLMAGQKDKAIELFKSVQGKDGAADLAHIWLLKINSKAAA